MDEIELPRPRLSSTTSVGDALRNRKTTRMFSKELVSFQLLSDALFAACGVNRPDGPFGGPGATAASASNSQEVDVYVALAQGAYRFDRPAHALVPISSEDLRLLAYTPHQPLIAPEAPVQLVFVVDVAKLEHTTGFDEPGLHDPEVQKAYYFVDTGIIAAHLYLFAAANGLACWFHNCDKEALRHKLALRDTQRVLFAQTLGYAAQ